MKKTPQICGKVFEFLDDKSLCQSKLVCKSWLNFIENEKIYWRRVVGNSKEWNIVIVKMASENVKSLGNHYINPGFRRKNFDKTCHPIYCAISLDNLEIIQEVLDAFPTLLNPPILDSHPLNYAARKGKFQIFQAVKNSGGILHPRCDDAGGWTPLHFAAEKNQIEFFKIYIEKISGEVLIEDDNEETPLDLALDCDHLELVKFLIEHSGGNFKVVRRNRDSRGLIQNAALKGLFDIFKIAFEKLIGDKNPRLRGNVTLLHLAASGGNIEICQFLINNIQGIVDMSKTNGETPLHEASSKGQIEVCKLLVDKMGIDKNPKDNQGRTPLHLAALKGHLEVCKFLLEHVEGEKNPPDFQGNTPFHLAASKGRMDTSLLFLRDLQQDPDQENFEQKTPVILARDYFALAKFDLARADL